ncbi:hypothetical protein GW17_00055440 [Ensete ventricosum]|nr:hypothetical protein GW17_00055440 [Ensete ventricosum]
MRKWGSKPWPGHLQGWLAMARPSIGVVDHGLASCKGVVNSSQPARGSRLWPRLPTVGAVASAVGATVGGQGQPSPAQG